MKKVGIDPFAKKAPEEELPKSAMKKVGIDPFAKKEFEEDKPKSSLKKPMKTGFLNASPFGSTDEV